MRSSNSEGKSFFFSVLGRAETHEARGDVAVKIQVQGVGERSGRVGKRAYEAQHGEHGWEGIFWIWGWEGDV